MEDTRLAQIQARIAELPDDALAALDSWLHALLAERQAAARETPPVKAGREVVAVERTARGWVRLEYVVCGKENCRCARGLKHGPYWYRYWREGKTIKSKYAGRQRPSDG